MLHEAGRSMDLTDPKDVDRLELPTGKDEVRVFDTAPRVPTGFGLRLRRSGKRVRRTWIVQHRVPAGSRTHTLGSVEIMSVKDARAAARTFLAKVQLGGDPQAERAAAKARAATTLKSKIDAFLEHIDRRVGHQHSAATRRYLTTTWAPLNELGLGMIDRRAVANRLSEIAAEKGPIASNRARVALNSFFKWAVGKGLADENPVVGTVREAQEKPRERTLTADELRSVWQASRDDDHGRIVRLLVLTGQRREEVGAIRWSEIELERRLWVLPSERSKNGKPHEIPLSDPAVQILSAVSRRDGRDLVFGEGRGPFSGWSKGKAGLDSRIATARAAAGLTPVPGWRLHDLRRTVSTMMHEDIGVLPHLVEAVLNHVSGHRAGVAGTYNKAIYRNEKRVALDRWSAHVLVLVAEEINNVVALRS